jgi:HEAT repeat protein
MTRSLAQQLASLEPEAQILLLSALETRQDKTAAPFVQKAATSDNAEVQAAALKALGILGNSEHVAFLARTSVADGAQGKASLDSLKRITGDGVTSALLTLTQSSSPADLRINVIEALVDRHELSAASTLCQVAKDSNAQVRQASYRGLSALADAQEIPAMVSLLLTAKSASDRSALERALISVIGRTGTAGEAPVIKGLAQADNSVKANLLAILPIIGTDKALASVQSLLKSPDVELRKNAIRTMSRWPNDQPLADLMAIAKTEADSVQQILALRGYVQLLGVPANRSAVKTVSLLEDALAVAKRTEEKQLILATLSKYPCNEAVTLAKKLQQDPALSQEAEIAVTKLKEIMAKQSRTAAASPGGNEARLAIDDNLGTRWTTGRGMKPGDWFVLDLGMESTVTGLTLDTRNSSNDYPREYEVYVSFDGGNWGQPIVTGKGTDPLTKIRFPRAVTTRFIKILQNGSSDSWHWSIHELTVDKN